MQKMYKPGLSLVLLLVWLFVSPVPGIPQQCSPPPQKRPLDIVYYYIRSLTASNPIISARDALVAMFDDIRKRVSPAPFSLHNYFFHVKGDRP